MAELAFNEVGAILREIITPDIFENIFRYVSELDEWHGGYDSGIDVLLDRGVQETCSLVVGLDLFVTIEARVTKFAFFLFLYLFVTNVSACDTDSFVFVYVCICVLVCD